LTFPLEDLDDGEDDHEDAMLNGAAQEPII
jgi:hypothetical protein